MAQLGRTTMLVTLIKAVAPTLPPDQSVPISGVFSTITTTTVNIIIINNNNNENQSVLIS